MRFHCTQPLFSSPGRSPGRAIVLPPASASVSASALAKCYSFYVEVFYVMGKALSGELSCPCDRSCMPSTHGLDMTEVFLKRT